MRLMLAASAALLGSSIASNAQQSVESCAALANTAIAGGFVTSANVRQKEGVPDYCEVRATALPAIQIEVRLPMEGWNGNLYQAGCGGFCGILGRADAAADANAETGGGWVNAMRPGLEKGYATATSDSGHHGLSVVDAAWAEGNQHAERDWGYRSIGETNRVAGLMMDAFYGTGADQSVFQGCSTGGRMAHMAALRYPDMFDGIISGAPAMDYTGLVATKMSYLMQANTAADGSQILNVNKVPLIQSIVTEACGEPVADPRTCEPSFAEAVCASENTDSCLTLDEVGVLEKWYQGPVNSAGEQLYPGGVPAGSEPFWWLWLTGNGQGGGKLGNAFATNFTAFMAFDQDPGAGWSPTDFDFDADPGRMGVSSGFYNSDNPDISAFREAGGKMIVWHGWGDAIVTPFKTVDWYEKASEAAGGEETLKENVALFMIPGVDHCGILPGPAGITQANIDPLTPLEAWMNDGVVPTDILK